MVKDVTYIEDYKLVDEYMNGNRESGEKLYAKVFEMLPKFIYKITSKSILTKEEKEEIIEETYIESVDKLNKYNGNCKFTTFVIGIAKNKCKEKIRKTCKINELELSIEEVEIEDQNYYNKNPLTIIIQKEEEEKINKVMNKLKEEDRQILQLRIINKIKTKEISKITGENVETLSSRYRRAIKKFKKYYEEM